MGTRRNFLALAGLAAGFGLLRWKGSEAWDRLGGLPDLVPLDSPQGFRMLGGDGVSAGLSDPFVGLGEADGIRSVPLEGVDLCAALFGKNVPDGVVPIAYFGDYNCPYCRELGRDLEGLAENHAGEVQIIWHELPLLGPGSVLGARAALAARQQGQYRAMHHRLNTGVIRITDGFIRQIAQDLQMDVGRLFVDMARPEIDLRLQQSKGAAEAFEVVGTPFLVVGRTAVIGRVSPTRLNQLVLREQQDGHTGACGQTS